MVNNLHLFLWKYTAFLYAGFFLDFLSSDEKLSLRIVTFSCSVKQVKRQPHKIVKHTQTIHRSQLHFIEWSHNLFYGGSSLVATFLGIFVYENPWQCFLWYLRLNPISSVHHFTNVCNRVLRTAIINVLFNLLCEKCLLTVKLSCNTYYYCKLSSWEVACIHFLIVSMYFLWRYNAV